MGGQIVCDTCRMKIPSEIHAMGHFIVMGHTTRLLEAPSAAPTPPSKPLAAQLAPPTRTSATEAQR